MLVNISFYIILALFIFILGLAGIFLNRRNMIILLMSIELMLLSINLLFITYSTYLDDISGQIFVIFILTIAAAESAIGLAILVNLYHVRGTISIQFINLMKG